MSIPSIDSIANLFMQSTKPECVICNKEVDKFYAKEDYMLNKIVMIAECHGESELHKLDNDFFIHNNISDIGRGYAFEHPLIGRLEKYLGMLDTNEE